MGRSVRVGFFVAILAICCLQDVASYNPYAYNPSYFPKTDSDSYAAMGDINWAKRGYRHDILQSLMEPTYGYASMADANWGWKKRSDDNADLPDAEALSTPKRGFIQRSYKYRQPYMRARPRADRIQRYAGKRGGSQTLIQPYQAYARYGAISRPQTRKLGNRQYSFYSMADAPWGWKKSPETVKSIMQSLLDPDDSTMGMADDHWGGGYGSPSHWVKRSELPALLPNLNEEIEDTNPMEEDLEKRNLASMARSNMFPRKLRSFDEMRAGDEDNLDLIEEKEEDALKH